MDLNSIFQAHEDSLNLRTKRVQLLASNLANQDTPGYKSKDIDFAAVLKDMKYEKDDMIVTNQRHIMDSENRVGEYIKETPTRQPKLDGNTVDPQLESAKFAQNSVQYLASIRFIEHQVRNILTSIKGE